MDEVKSNFDLKKVSLIRSPIIYSCDCCKCKIVESDKRVKCLECDNVDLCIGCYNKNNIAGGHLSTHRVLIIPAYIDTEIINNENDNQINTPDDAIIYDNDISTDVDDDLIVQCEQQLNKLVYGSLLQKGDNCREEVGEIDESLAYEILDAMCYFQYDIEGIQRVLSKYVNEEILRKYIFEIVLKDDDTQPSHVFNSDMIEEKEEEEEVTRESFSPTVLEYAMKYVTLDTCNEDMMLSLKGVEPLLHQTHKTFINKTQFLSLLACTSTSRFMQPIKKRLCDVQSKLLQSTNRLDKIYPSEVILNPTSEEQKKKIMETYAQQTFFFLSPQQFNMKRKETKRKRKSSKRSRHRKQKRSIKQIK